MTILTLPGNVFLSYLSIFSAQVSKLFTLCSEIAAELPSRLEGSFRRGLANGRGTLKTKEEDKIEGDFVDHMPHGKILMQRPNGERIEGQFRQVGG